MDRLHSRVLFAGAVASAIVLGGCLSDDSSGPGPNPGLDASLDVDVPTLDASGNVPGADGGDAGHDATAPGAPPHPGFALAPGAVRASSSKHVVVTTTGQSPAGSPTLHSSKHTLLGGSVGGTQKP